MGSDTKDGWFARRREHRRVEREEARRRQEQLDELLVEYPVDRSRHPESRAGSTGGRCSNHPGPDGGGWSDFGDDHGDGDDGILSLIFGGDWCDIDGF